LKDLTIIYSLLITFSLLYMLYKSCTDGTFECNLHAFPMVSNVIGLQMNDRAFLLLATGFMFGVQ
jgi:hypothetical protein